MMKQYRYQFNTFITLSSYIYQHSFKLRCIPVGNSSQQLIEAKVDIEPAPNVEQGTDVFGNTILTGEIVPEHKSFVIRSQGIVKMGDYNLPEECQAIYKCPSSLTQNSRVLLEYNKDIAGKLLGSKYQQALTLTNLVYRHIDYTPGVTHTLTTASEVFEMRKGVCQDYAHLLITLCRMNDIPARYVCGFMQGEGVTHAWVEVYDEGYWKAVDPTHNRAVETGYIKLAHGRDSSDCPVNRGVFFGNTPQSTCVEVIVEEI